MILIIGLGNPGKKFENTRHNVGFMAIDKFAEKNNFPDFVLNKKSNALISEKPFDSAQGDENIILVKPQTFMNESGKAVSKLISNFKFQISNLVIVHDDIDLELGKIKIVQERGSAGHKGVESIIQNIGNDGLIRIRIGINSAQSCGSDYRTKKAKEVVLKKFLQDEKKIIEETIEKVADVIDSLIKNGLEKAMNKFNK